ncbi:MAG: hypothetical protein B7Y39_03725 [Bdellovibrio sp. 28-41-41]|nr:MAG: hypothetical protein B7Y39_03725 [Bdellovibrio sp. 28-41-41]
MNKTETKVEIKKEEALLKIKAIKDSNEDAYSQINQIAFQQNYKALIGHFKKDLNFNSTSFR